MKEYYDIKVAGLTRRLPICPLNDQRCIAGFVIFGDVELTVNCARELLKLVPEYDYLLAPEAKAIPLVYEMARQSGHNKYFLARKAPKLYMRHVFKAEVRSITTDREQCLYLDGADAELMRGKRIILLDDVISTGESLKALENLAEKAGAEIVGRMAILAEGEAADRNDILFLERLPMFDNQGEPLE